jgi:hypothetical protein
MTKSRLFRVFLLFLLASGHAGGCNCGGDQGDGQTSIIDEPLLADENPDAPRAVFPEDRRTDDPSLNAFVEKAMRVCSEGDYDGFRQLFGTAYQPTERKQFKRIWAAVREIRVERVHAGRGEPLAYYVHAEVHWRKPDKNRRLSRSAVIMAYQEGGQWRIGSAPREAVRAILGDRSGTELRLDAEPTTRESR